MTPSRRKFMKIAGSSAVILATGAGTYAATRTPKDAVAPWQQAGLGATPMITALSYAILAPNPHNRQPWLVGLKSDVEAVLTCDADRRLPVTDPFDRQITIGLDPTSLRTASIAPSRGLAIMTIPGPPP